MPSLAQKLGCEYQRPGWPSEDGPLGGQGAGHPDLERPHIPHLYSGCPQAPYPEQEASRS